MSREEMLGLIKSPSIDPMTFDFDRLVAPPMLAFITPQDLQYLQYLANSIKLNAKLDYKYAEIDKVLTNRGFEKIGSGTNRVAYKHLEYPGICLKVAASRVACTDSPREMINQEYLKPFVAKIFEVDPTGTVALCERVDPIRNREEFMMIVEDVFDLITQWFTGKYVVDDIGTNFFMNWGTRLSNGFPVLHDYPYFYPLDPKKLVCRRPLDDGGVCNGEIDYDPGYNYLICTKCGSVYKANDLAQAVTNNKILVNDQKGTVHMKVQIKRGEDTLKTFDSVSEAKKVQERYAQAEETMLKARVVAVKDEQYVKQLHASDNSQPAEETKLKVSVVPKKDKKEKPKFDTDGKFIPRGSSEEHDVDEVVVERSPLVAGAGNVEKQTVEDTGDGEIDHGENDGPTDITDAVRDAVVSAIEESKNDVVDAVDDLPEQTAEDDVVAGSSFDTMEEDGRSEEDTVLVAGAGQTEGETGEEEEADSEAAEVSDNSAVNADGEVEDVVEEPVNEVPPTKKRKRSARFDPETYV